MSSVRRFWWRKIRRWEGELCQLCGRKYYPVVWWADERLWKAIAPWNLGILCPRCFSSLAMSYGKTLIWQPTWALDEDTP